MQLKPTDDSPALARHAQKVLVLPQQHMLALYSKKLSYSIFRLQFVAGYFWDRRKFTLDYRCVR